MHHHTPLVAVLTPVDAKTRPFLAQTIESVQAQSYPHLLHLLVFDMNTARGEPVEHRFMTGDVRVLRAVSTEQHLDSVDLWNFALSSAPDLAAYLRPLRAGDLLDPDSIARSVEVLEQDPGLDIALHNHRLPRAPGPELDPDAPLFSKAFDWPEGVTALEGAEFVRRFFRRQLDFTPSHMLLRTPLRLRRGAFFDPRLPMGRFEGVLAAALQGGVALIDEMLGEYADRPPGAAAEATARDKDFMVALHRHGPEVFPEKAFRSLAGRYRRHYLRNTLQWRVRFGAAAAAPHFAALKAHGAPPHPLAVADAMLDGALVWAGFLPEWSSLPG